MRAAEDIGLRPVADDSHLAEDDQGHDTAEHEHGDEADHDHGPVPIAKARLVLARGAVQVAGPSDPAVANALLTSFSDPTVVLRFRGVKPRWHGTNGIG